MVTSLFTFLRSSLFFQHCTYGLPQYPQILSEVPVLDIFPVQLHDFVEIRDTAPPANLPHSGDSRFHGESGTVSELVLFYLGDEGRSGAYEGDITSLCQLRNNFFSKISHKAQYYQLTLKISTKKEPLISQKSQTLRFYLYSISPNCTILA